MTTAHLCIAIAICTPYLFTTIAKLLSGGFGPKANKDPRGHLAKATGVAYRADCAQRNSFEVVPAFGIAVLVAQQIGQAPQDQIDIFSLVFVASRLLYGLCYLADWGAARSLMWLTGAGVIIGLFVISA